MSGGSRTSAQEPTQQPTQDERDGGEASRSSDPHVAQLLEWASRARQPTFPMIGAIAARAVYDKAARLLDIVPPELHAVRDLALPLPGRTLAAREYLPREPGWHAPLPVLLYFHGGGFTIGSLDTHDRLCRALAQAGDCAVLSVDYRLAPEHRFPAAADDAFDALAWLRAHAETQGYDLHRIAVGGDSAGGTLAAACALHARDRGWPLALQLLIYPGLAARQDSASHRRFARGFLLDADVVQWFFSQVLRDDVDRGDWRFAPLQVDSVEGVAPAWFGLAALDPLVDEGLAYAERLRGAGIAAETVVYEGMVHAFFQHGGFVPRARDAHADAGRALRRAFGTD